MVEPTRSPLGPQVLEELGNLLLRQARELDWGVVGQLAQQLDHARRVLLFGAGRSGSTALAFAQRLNHVGVDAAVVGESTNRRIGEGDVVIVVSGSGATASAVTIATEAKATGCQVVAISSTRSSSLALLADVVVELKARSKGQRDDVTQSPYTAQFDVSVFALSEVVGALLLERRQLADVDIEKWRPNVE